MSCIASEYWLPNLLEQDDGLSSGIYNNSFFLSAFLTPDNFVNSNITSSFGFVPDCSDPWDRLMDHILNLLGDTLQCTQPIGPYDFSVGEAYGLFYNALPDLSLICG